MAPSGSGMCRAWLCHCSTSCRQWTSLGTA